MKAEDRTAMQVARDALYPRPHNPNNVDVIDVARWDAFKAGYEAATPRSPAHSPFRSGNSPVRTPSDRTRGRTNYSRTFGTSESG